MKSLYLAIGLALGFALTLSTMPANAGGYVSGGVSYHMNSGGTFSPGAPVVIHQYPSGRVVVQHVPVTNVYPNGENLVYQNGGQRVYTQGYGGAATCYVECWHGGVRPGGGSGSHFNVNIGVNKTW